MASTPPAIRPETFRCPLPKSQYDQVLLGHGSGGLLTAELIQRLFLPAFGGEVLAALEDQATLPLEGGGAARLAFTTDSFVVRPLFFPSGDSCPNVGGICIACTMPGFPDKFMPFMDEPPGAASSTTLVGLYGRIIRSLRAMTNTTVNKEPRWRHRGRQLTPGYHPTTYGSSAQPAAHPQPEGRAPAGAR
jgi:hypothetical protein